MTITITLTSAQVTDLKAGKHMLYDVYATPQAANPTTYDVHARNSAMTVSDTVVGTTT